MDEFYSSRKSVYYSSVEHEKILFEWTDHVDLDHLVQSPYLTITSFTSEAQCGIENLWQRVNSNGRCDCANFSRHIFRNYFKTFVSTFPYLFGHKK